MHAVRNAALSDAPILLALIREHAAFERSSATITLSRLAQLLGQGAPSARLFVAELTEGPVGYASLTFDFATWRGAMFGHLDCLFVRESQRGSGLGKQLFDYVAQVARQAGADRLEWQTPEWNRRAKHFYDREGGVAELKQRFRLDLTSE